MTKHFFKLIWNKRKKHMLLVIELVVAYLVVSFLACFLISTGDRYARIPKFDSENIVMLEVRGINDTLRQNLLGIREVTSISSADFIPYKNRYFHSDDTLQYGSQKIPVRKRHTDEHLQSTLKLTMQSGSWFTASDKNNIQTPLIISSKLKDNLFPGESAEGRVVKLDSLEYKITGVVNDLNDPANTAKEADVFVMQEGGVLLVRLNQPLDNVIYRKIKNAMTGFQAEFAENIFPIQDYKDEFYSEYWTITLIFAALAIFLIINVVLGLFSMLYQNIHRRKPEIGLRRATGATSRQIYGQIVLEVVLLATIALIPGIIMAYQAAVFELMGERAQYYPAMISGACIIYLLGIMCALYPAKLASKIQPAMALHEE